MQHAVIVHLRSLSCAVFSVFVLIEGQGRFAQSPEDNYNLPRDPCNAMQDSLVMQLKILQLTHCKMCLGWCTCAQQSQ